jgi:hypothetical protein
MGNTPDADGRTGAVGRTSADCSSTGDYSIAADCSQNLSLTPNQLQKAILAGLLWFGILLLPSHRHHHRRPSLQSQALPNRDAFYYSSKSLLYMPLLHNMQTSAVLLPEQHNNQI